MQGLFVIVNGNAKHPLAFLSGQVASLSSLVASWQSFGFTNFLASFLFQTFEVLCFQQIILQNLFSSFFCSCSLAYLRTTGCQVIIFKLLNDLSWDI